MNGARLALLLAGYFGILLGGVIALQDPALAWRMRPAGVVVIGGLTPDGTDLEAPTTGQTGAAAGCLNTVYGQWCLGDIVEPNFRGGGPQFYEVMLNGVVTVPTFNIMYAQRLFVGFGGNFYASFHGDELIGGWENNGWEGDNGQTGPDGFPGAGGNQVPVGVPTPPPLPGFVWAGPYMASPDGTTISGGTGMVMTAEGSFTFGAPSGGGYVLMKNGIPIWPTSSTSPYIVQAMKISAQGNLFVQFTDSSWSAWVSYQMNPTSGSPPVGPIPVRIRFLDGMGVPDGGKILPVGTPIGSYASNVFVQMSDGSPFTGTMIVGLDDTGHQSLTNSPMSPNSVLVTNESPWGSSFTGIEVIQNGQRFDSKIHLFSSP